MSEHSADPHVVCPFVAFDDDRDFRSPVPDHRHRCFAESPAAPRALAHQAAYCLASSFPSCPTFVDWARREAAPPKVESPVRSLRGPAGPPRGASAPPIPPAGTPVDSAPPSSGSDWAAPPPWGAVAGAAAAGATGAGRGPDQDESSADRVGPEGQAPRDANERYAPPAAPDDTPAFLAGRSARPTPVPVPAAAPSPAAAPGWQGDEAGDADDDGLDDGYADSVSAEPPAPRPVAEPRRVPVGYAPVPATKNDRRAGGSRNARSDPSAPSWEQPRRSEAYPTLKSRGGGGGIPRLAIYAIVILLVGAGLFATPFLLKGLGGGGDEASPTPAASGSLTPAA